jgi:hypothetical protein
MHHGLSQGAGHVPGDGYIPGDRPRSLGSLKAAMMKWPLPAQPDSHNRIKLRFGFCRGLRVGRKQSQIDAADCGFRLASCCLFFDSCRLSDDSCHLRKFPIAIDQEISKLSSCSDVSEDSHWYVRRALNRSVNPSLPLG